MFTLNKKQHFIISMVIVLFWLITSIIVVNIENANAQTYEPLPPNIWTQAHEFENGWGIICLQECEAFNALGSELEFNLRFSEAWMTVVWYQILFNRRYCETTGVCLELLPPPQYPTG